MKPKVVTKAWSNFYVRCKHFRQRAFNSQGAAVSRCRKALQTVLVQYVIQSWKW